MLIVSADAEGEVVNIKHVFDGARAELTDGRRLRLVGVDAPRMNDYVANEAAAARLGIEADHYRGYAGPARRFLRDLILGKTIDIEEVTIPDDGRYIGSEKDIWAYLFLDAAINPRLSSYQSLNAALIGEGYAAADRAYAYGRSGDFRRLEDKAKRARKGIWSASAS